MGRLLAERDSGVNPAPLDDLLERGGERVFQSFALIGEELLEHRARSRSCRGVGRRVGRCADFESVGRVAALDGVDCIEHGDVHHGHGPRAVGRKLLGDENPRDGLLVPVEDRIGHRRGGRDQERRADTPLA